MVPEKTGHMPEGIYNQTYISHPVITTQET